MLGSNPIQRSQVDQWISWCNTTVMANLYPVMKAIFGWAEVQEQEYKDSLGELKKNIRTLLNALKGKTWLVGDEMTIADVVVASALILPFQTVLDEGFRKGHADVAKW